MSKCFGNLDLVVEVLLEEIKVLDDKKKESRFFVEEMVVRNKALTDL